MSTYAEVLEGIKTKFATFVTDAEAGAEDKGAALRARKTSMELRKDLQDFRKASVTNDRARTKVRAPKVAAAPATTPVATPAA